MELILKGYGQEVCRIWTVELYCIVTSTIAMRVLNVCCIRNCAESTLRFAAAQRIDMGSFLRRTNWQSSVG